MPEFPEDFTPLGRGLVEDDMFIVNKRKIAASDMKPYFGGGAAPLFVWNGVDLSQFDTPFIVGSVVNPVWAVVDSPANNGQKLIQFTADSIAENAIAILPFLDPIAPQDHEAEFFASVNRTPGENAYAGVSWARDAVAGTALTHLIGYGTDDVASTFAARSETGGGALLVNATNSGGQGYHGWRADMSKTTGKIPALANRWRTEPIDADPATMAAGGYGGQLLAFPSAWETATCDGWALVATSTFGGGGCGAVTVYFASLTVVPRA